MIAPMPSRHLGSGGVDSESLPPLTLIVESCKDAASARRAAFQLALVSHDGYVRISRTEDVMAISSHADELAGQRRTQCRILANLTFRDGANIAVPGTEARSARESWVHGTQALLRGDLATFRDQVIAAESLLEDALLQAALAEAASGGESDEKITQFYLDMSLAVHHERLHWNALCRELDPSQAAK